MARVLSLLLILVSASPAAAESAAEVMRNVASALGVSRFSRLPNGLVLHDARSGGATTSAVIAVDARGRVRHSTIGRNGVNEWLYDGESLWMVDPTKTSSRRGVPVPVRKDLLEKTLLPVWVRTGYWAAVGAPLDITIEQTTAEEVTLAVQMREGTVRATIAIDRASWLPTRLSVPYERGPFMMEMSGSGLAQGIVLASCIETAYAGTRSTSRLTFAAPIPPADASLLRTLPRPAGTSFDHTVPAAVPVVRGATDSGGRLGHPFVRPLVDGRDVGFFHFDTGSQAMMIDARIADELGMPIVAEAEAMSSDGVARKVTVRQGKSFQLGRLRIESPLFLAEDMSRMSAPAGASRAGFCGYPLFVRALFEVVDGGAAVAVHDPSTYELARGRWLDLEVQSLTPAVAAVVNDRHRGVFLIDTGVDHAVTLNARFAANVKTATKPVEETMTGSGGSTRIRTTTLPSFEFAGLRFTRPDTILRLEGHGKEAEGVDGIIGRRLLEGTTVIFDYGRQRIAVVAPARDRR
ncbi:MAG TPA: retropepsin-like aspartic protease [Thermoanaerobaculia bacterium]|nr:retropepsin-like aspartic protease [Thermoanaerobaculia bacterium]